MAFGSTYNDISSGVGIAATEYGQRTRQLIKLITELRALGAQTIIDLPRIAVIGNQSAGKSSLVEAISGITVPRSSGTCTRCPMECRLRNSSGPWRCQVLLRFEKDEYGQRMNEITETNFGPPLTDKAALENVLRRAQLAILNPSVPYQKFIDLDLSTIVPGQPPAGSTKLLQFSSNIVCMDLSSPDVVDLSFIDLPGIISNVADGEDRNNIELIRDLVKENIRGNALILLTLTMRDDLENQSASFLAREADPDGLRTVGVLTKADTIYAGEETSWLQVLEGDRHSLKHGYYVTKQPGTEELSQRLTYQAARERERSFFSEREPWKSSSSRVKARTGIPNLTNELSKLLSQLIIRTLPKLREDALKSRDENEKSLQLLPSPLPDNPVAELLRLLTEFTNQANKWIYAEEKHEDLLHKFRLASAHFKASILKTSPDFRPFESPKDEPLNSMSTNMIEDDSGVISEISELPPIYLPEVQQHIQRSLTRQLPFNVPYSAKCILMERSLTNWNDHASAYFAVIYSATVNHLDTIIESHFSRFVMSPLRDHVLSLIHDEVNKARKITEEHIAWFLELERPPFSQNDHYVSSLRDTYLGKYKALRQAHAVKPTYPQSYVSQALGMLESAGYRGLTAEHLQKLLPNDKYEVELLVMAEVSAYVRVAYKRVIDDIPRIVDHDFFLSISKNILQALMAGLGLGGENSTERATMYLMEDPAVVEKREALVANRARLDAVLKKLFTFGI